MRKLLEYSLMSLDGVMSGADIGSFFEYRDAAYYRDGLGQLLACDAMLLGRTTYQSFASLWPGREHPWADRLNTMPKYVFSSTLECAEWENTTLIRGNVVDAVRTLKQQPGGDLVIWGHGQLTQTLMRHGLIDAVDLSVHPVVLGHGGLFFREGENISLRLIAAKAFSRGIVKLTYEPLAAAA
jgi:dihydrofolate reductase